MSELYSYAQEELKRVDLGYDGMINEAVLELVKLFADQGHSGQSAYITIEVAQRLMRFEPLAPLTGEDDEWNEVGTDQFQNRRCSHVFKDSSGKAWDINLPPQANNSWAEITFPYTPGN